MMVKKILFVFLFCPIFWFLITHFKTALEEWGKIPVYVSQGGSSLFSTDKIRYSVELNGDSFLTRTFYNKLSYLVGIIFKSLATTSPRNIFIGENFQLIPAIFLPLWLVGVYRLIRNKKIWWFILFSGVSVLIYLTGQTSPYFLSFIVVLYIYAICLSF